MLTATHFPHSGNFPQTSSSFNIFIVEDKDVRSFEMITIQASQLLYGSMKDELTTLLDANQQNLRNRGVSNATIRYKLACLTGYTPRKMHEHIQHILSQMIRFSLEDDPAVSNDIMNMYKEGIKIVNLRSGVNSWRYGSSDSKPIELYSWLQRIKDPSLERNLNAFRFRRLMTCENNSTALDLNLSLVHALFMEAYFVKLKSTLNRGGLGLFLQAHIKLMPLFRLPYTGQIARSRPLTVDEIQSERAFLVSTGLFIVANSDDMVSFMNMTKSPHNQFGFASTNGLIKLISAKPIVSANKVLELFINYGGRCYDEWKHRNGAYAEEQSSTYCVANTEKLDVDQPGLVMNYFQDPRIGDVLVSELERVGIASFQIPGFEADVQAAIGPCTIDTLCDGVVKSRSNHSSLLSISGSLYLRKYFKYDDMFQVSAPRSKPLPESVVKLQRLIDGPLRIVCHELMNLIDNTVTTSIGHPVRPHAMVWHTVGVISLPGAACQDFHGDVAPQVNSLTEYSTSQSTLSVLGN